MWWLEIYIYPSLVGRFINESCRMPIHNLQHMNTVLIYATVHLLEMFVIILTACTQLFFQWNPNRAWPEEQCYVTHFTSYGICISIKSQLKTHDYGNTIIYTDDTSRKNTSQSRQFRTDKMHQRKISSKPDWWSTLRNWQFLPSQSHVTRKLRQISEIWPDKI